MIMVSKKTEIVKTMNVDKIKTTINRIAINNLNAFEYNSVFIVFFLVFLMPYQ